MIRGIFHTIFKVKCIVALAFYLVTPLYWTSITTHTELAMRVNAGIRDFLLL